MKRVKACVALALLSLLAAVPGGALAARAVVDWEFDHVNVRAAPSRTGEAVGRLAAGAEAETLEAQGEWTRVRFPGGSGWVVSRSLRPLPEPPPPPAPVPAPPAAAPSTPPPEVAEVPAPAAPPAPPLQPPPAETQAGSPDGYLSQYRDAPELPALDTGSGVVSALSSLLLVLALIAGAVFAARKLLGSRLPSARRPGGVRVLASRPVAPRQALLLIEVEGLVWLVGQGPDGLRRIDRIEDPRALERLDDRYEFLETPFQSELRRNLNAEDQAEDAAPAAAPVAPDNLTREQRLAALRRRGKPADGA